MSEHSEESKTSRNVIFSWRSDVCVYVRVCVFVRFSTFQSPITHKFFGKYIRGSSNLPEIRAIVLKLRTNILYQSRNFGIEFGQNRLRVSNFFRF